MSQHEARRAIFERWAGSHYWLMELGVDRDSDGDYSDPDVQVAWEAWCAAADIFQMEVTE